MRHHAFNNVVGQHAAVEQLSHSLNNVGTNEIIQPLLLGPAGIGKTELARAYGNEVARLLNCDFREFSTPGDFRLKNDWDPILEYIVNTPRFVLFIDEVHELEKGKPAHAQFLAYLRKALDRQNTGKCFQIGEFVTTFSREEKVIILGTNHPDKVDTALVSRMSKMDLQLYTNEELEDISIRLMEKFGIQFDSVETLQIMARCCRGTARPVVDMIHDCLISMGPMITVEKVMSALRMKQMFPHGLSLNEFRLVGHLFDTTDGTGAASLSRSQIVAAHPGIVGTLKHSIAHMSNRKLIGASRSGGIYLTKKGRQYKTSCEKAGFVY